MCLIIWSVFSAEQVILELFPLLQKKRMVCRIAAQGYMQKMLVHIMLDVTHMVFCKNEDGEKINRNSEELHIFSVEQK